MQTFVLGTAQWGLDYGATNRLGRPSDAMLAQVMEIADRGGVTAVDTALSYGDAQIRMRPWAAGLRVTTKVSGRDPASVRAELELCLATLGLERVDVCLLHDWSELEQPQALLAAKAMHVAQADGLVGSVGVSCYDEGGLRRAQRIFGHVEVAQVPVSILDQRLVASAVVEEMHDSGTRFQARSVFLQGLLAKPIGASRQDHPDIAKFFHFCVSAGLNPLAAAINFVRSVEWITDIIMGAAEPTELVELVAVWQTAARPLQGPAEWLRSDDDALIDPRQWE